MRRGTFGKWVGAGAATLSMLSTMCRVHVSGRALSDAALDEIHGFMLRHVRKTRDEVHEHLRACAHVYLLRDANGGLQGLIAYDVVHERCGARPVFVIYAQWSILDHALRGLHCSQAAAFDVFLRERARRPLHAGYLVMKASTFKSYLILARNAATVWPSRRAAIPNDVRAMRDRVLRRMVGEAYDAAAGVVRGKGEMQYFEGKAYEEPTLEDPDVALYAQLNPGQPRGDGLAVTTPLSLANWGHELFRALRVGRGKRLGRGDGSPARTLPQTRSR